jgi:predicted RNase H-like HicB family nuclease
MHLVQETGGCSRILVRPISRGAEILSVESPSEGYSMAREFSVIIERDVEGYYLASVPALRGCHTQATSLDELMVRVREAVELSLEVQGENAEPLDFIGVQKITVA